MVRMLYRNATSCTVNNGYSSKWFSISRSLRQGCCYSPPAFLIFIEILGAKIRQNEKIEGIQITSSKNKKQSQFADDLWASLKNASSVYNLFQEMEYFARVSGLKINYNKTQLMRIGSLRRTMPILYTQKPVSWSKRVKILGIVFANDKTEMIQANYEPLLAKTKKVLENWQNRSLTLIGKVLVVNTLVMSLLSHAFLCTYSPVDKFHIELKKIICNFLWDGGKPRIKYDRLIKSYTEGGLKLVDSRLKNAALKCKWLKLIQEKDAVWSHFAYESFPLPVGDILRTNISPSDLRVSEEMNKDSIWFEVWEAWSKFNENVELNQYTSEIVNQPIWFNSQLLKCGGEMFNQYFSEKGIRYIQDILDLEKGEFFSFDVIQNTHDLRDMDFLSYYAIVASIPPVWKAKLKNKKNIDPTPIKENLEILEQKKPTNKIYWCMVNSLELPDPARVKWQMELNITLEEDEWGRIRLQPFIVTLSTKLRFFQFRLLSNRLTTNIMRNKWDKNITVNCAFCNTNKGNCLSPTVVLSSNRKFLENLSTVV